MVKVMSVDHAIVSCSNAACARRNRVQLARIHIAACGHCGTPLKPEVWEHHEESSAKASAEGTATADVLGELERKWDLPPGPTVSSVDPAVAEREAEAEAFLKLIEEFPWFSNLGRPHHEDQQVVRLTRWDRWPGPEVPGVAVLHTRHSDLRDALTSSPQAEALWQKAERMVMQFAVDKVPYDPEEDCWYGPTLAVRQLAWTAGLIALCKLAGSPVPPELREQWRWYAHGHWPAGYASVGEDGELGPLLVY